MMQEMTHLKLTNVATNYKDIYSNLSQTVHVSFNSRKRTISVQVVHFQSMSY